VRRAKTELKRGRLVAIEGIDRGGKSSLVQALPGLLSDCTVPIIVCRERQSPLASLIGDQHLAETSAFLKTYLFATDRAWTCENKACPVLSQGGLVLWDRYVDSALAYRAVEISLKQSKIDIGFVEAINKPFQPADLTIYIDISAETSVARAERQARRQPYGRPFLEAVQREYMLLAKRRNYVVINGERSPETVAQEAASKIREAFGEMFK